MNKKVNHDRIKTITLGCRLNLQESEVMKAHAHNAGLGETLIINTCAVTNQAVSRGRQSIRRARRENPEAKIIVTGCASQIDPKSYVEMDGVDHVLGNAEKMRAESFQPNALKTNALFSDIMRAQDTNLPMGRTLRDITKSKRARAIVQVQNGCDHRCTFCIIPYGRGNSRSVRLENIVDQIKGLIDDGFNEVVLSGVDISSWGEDLEHQPKLGHLVGTILDAVPDLPRLRLSSIDSAEIDDELFELIANEARLAPYLHLSLQHGDDLILKRMKRRHLRDDAIKLCQDLRRIRPDIRFGADIIAGFPTETDAAFENSLSLVDACDLTWLHVFPYSARQGTPAAKMPQIDGTEIKRRAARLRKRGDLARLKHLKARAGQNTGAYDLALIERGKDNSPQIGRLADFTPVELRPVDKESIQLQPGSLHPVRITSYNDTSLIGNIL